MEASIVKSDRLAQLDVVDARLAEFMGFENVVHNDIGDFVGELDGKLRFIPRFTANWLHSLELVNRLNECGYVLQLEQYKVQDRLWWDAAFITVKGKVEYQYSHAADPLEAISMAAYATVIDYNAKLLNDDMHKAEMLVPPLVEVNDEHIVITAIRKVGSITHLPNAETGVNYMFYLYVEGFQQPFRQFFATLEEAVEAKSSVLDKICKYCSK